jgi:anti-sigma B factor antagonist
MLRIAKQTLQPGVGLLMMKGSIHAGPECVQVEQEVDAMIAAGATRIIFEMAEVSHIDSAAIGAFIKCLTKLKKTGGNIRIAVPQPMISYSLKLTRVDTIIEMFPTVDEAATGFAPPGASAS